MVIREMSVEEEERDVRPKLEGAIGYSGVQKR